MQFIEDDDVETMIALYYSLDNVEPDELFVELTDVELVQNVTPLNKQYIVHNPYIKVPKVFVDRRSSIHKFDFNLNVGWVKQYDYGATLTSSKNSHDASILYNNPNLDPYLQIHQLVIGIDKDSKERPDNDDDSGH